MEIDDFPARPYINIPPLYINIHVTNTLYTSISVTLNIVLSSKLVL